MLDNTLSIIKPQAKQNLVMLNILNTMLNIKYFINRKYPEHPGEYIWSADRHLSQGGNPTQQPPSKQADLCPPRDIGRQSLVIATNTYITSS